MRLLLAEDEKEMAHALEAVFTHNHYSVDVVYNGIDAADWAESGNYDGMILDIMMPGKSGLEVLSEWTESIHHQIERLNSLVTQLLTLAKMEEGGGELELKTWNAEHPAASTHAKVPVGCFLNFPVNSKNIRAGSRCRAILQKNSIWKGMPQESTSSFLFLWITPLNTLRRVEKSTFSGEKTAKKQNFRCRIPAIPCRKVISTASLTASTVRMRRGPGKAAAMESAFSWQLQL